VGWGDWRDKPVVSSLSLRLTNIDDQPNNIQEHVVRELKNSGANSKVVFHWGIVVLHGLKENISV